MARVAEQKNSNIAVVCTSIEQGKDGIGDYSRALALCLKTSTNVVLLVAINDAFVQEIQEITSKQGIVSIRFPQSNSWSEKMVYLSQKFDELDIKWISLQFAAFGLEPRGLFFKALFPLAHLLKKYPTHVMMHELWLGESKGSSIKLVVWGRVIKYLIYFFLKKVKPKVVFVSCEVNQYLMNKMGWKALLNPVFSNIACTPLNQNEKDALFDLAFPRLAQKRNECMVLGFFGTVHPHWQGSNTMKIAQEIAKANQKNIVILFIGKITKEAITSFKTLMHPETMYFETGILAEEKISAYLQLCDYGISSNPILMLGKSGTVAAFLNHQIPVVVNDDGTRVEGFESEINLSKYILSPEEWLKYAKNKPQMVIAEQSDKFSPRYVASKMIKYMIK